MSQLKMFVTWGGESLCTLSLLKKKIIRYSSKIIIFFQSAVIWSKSFHCVNVQKSKVPVVYKQLSRIFRWSGVGKREPGVNQDQYEVPHFCFAGRSSRRVDDDVFFTR